MATTGRITIHSQRTVSLENLTLTTSALGDDVGLMGALALAQTLGDSAP